MRIGLAAFVVLSLAGSAWLAAAAPSGALREMYPYGGARFTRLLADSCDTCKSGKPVDFYNWEEKSYQDNYAILGSTRYSAIGGFLDATRRRISAIKDPRKRATAEVELGQRLHRFTKKTIPRFSLDRGYEFCNVVTRGERQCHLQATLIASMLQRAGVSAGIAMVYRNTKGDESNNGHSVTLVKLSDGRDIIVDASEPEPHARHVGLFLRAGGCKYVTPVYHPNSYVIDSYRLANDGRRIAPSSVQPMDYAFTRSQLYYYRGERQAGGLVNGPQTPQGLKATQRYLERSVKVCPHNPLAVYMLARTYLAEHDLARARPVLDKACGLYQASGWVPGGVKECERQARAQKPPK